MVFGAAFYLGDSKRELMSGHTDAGVPGNTDLFDSPPSLINWHQEVDCDSDWQPSDMNTLTTAQCGS